MNSPLSPQAAARELLIRRRARSDLLEYVNAVDVPGKPVGPEDETDIFQPIETKIAPHHRLILEKLRTTSLTPYGRLMIFMPPGSAKSTYASVVFPSFYLGEQGGRRLILTSYGDDLARKMGRRTRSIIRQKRYKGIFGTELASDSQAVQEFSLTNGSEYMSAGILSGITGNRANGIVVDDPIKGREAADSQTIREKTKAAFDDDVKTRLLPGGFIVIIQTRWQEDDLAGSILPEDWKGESGPILCRDNQVWEVLCLQARCEVINDPLGRKFGEYLWPEWFDPRHWAQFESNPRTWSALFQQLPREPEGTLFQQEHMLVDGKPVAYPAHCDTIYAVIDSALKTGDKNDGTGVTFWARSKYTGHPLILLDWDIVQIEGSLLEAWIPSIFLRLEDLAKQVKPRMGSLGLFVEDKASGIILLQQAKRRPDWQMQEIDARLVELGKDARGLSVSGYIYRGDVKISEYAYDKVVTYKGRTQNHFMSQFFGYRLGLTNQADDLYDCGVYGVGLSLGDSEGF